MLDLDWYAVATEPQREAVAQRALQQMGVATYGPSRRVETRRRGRLREVRQRVFPGYLFVGLERGREPWWRIDQCPAVLGVVGFGLPARPARIAPTVIGDLRVAEWRGDHDMRRLQDAALRIGRPVRLRADDGDGALAGRTGRIVHVASSERVMVLFGGERAVLSTTVVVRPLDAIDLL